MEGTQKRIVGEETVHGSAFVLSGFKAGPLHSRKQTSIDLQILVPGTLCKKIGAIVLLECGKLRIKK